jgi:sulfite reductase (NADPH) flavoprotein alpha-component
MFFGEELTAWSDTGQLTGLRTAFSRSGERHYVQDVLRQDATALQTLIANGAKVMVCGGRDMAQGVRDALSDVLAPLDLTASTLKSQGRYVEDAY